LKNFIKQLQTKIIPLETELKRTYWQAALSGRSEDYQKVSRLELNLRRLFSNTEDFAFLKGQKGKGPLADPLLERQLQLLYRAFLENQIDRGLMKQTVELSSKVEQKFSVFRAEIDGEKFTNNQLLEILKNEKDQSKRQKAWQSSKQVGEIVSGDLLELVVLRNQAAQSLGFENYYVMSLTLAEQDEKEITALFDRLYLLTNTPFAQAKAELDSILGRQFGRSPEQLQPWHYHDPFFQETPQILDLNLDRFLKNVSFEKLAADFYLGIGLPVDEILAHSDLYEKPKKNPHAFCEDMDKQGDVRILCNLKNTESWLETILHELGHAVYDKYKNYNLPYFLREPAHIFTTEAVAMFFGRLSRNACWLQKMLGLSEADRKGLRSLTQKYARIKQLIFARWAMVMFHFERALYADPQQDLNTLWWRLKEKYQLLNLSEKRYKPDWAAKIHFTIAPCYYHNYLLGELLASQITHYLVKQVLAAGEPCSESLIGQKEVGRFFKEKIFYPGKTLTWNEMIFQATGEYLTPKYYVRQFVEASV